MVSVNLLVSLYFFSEDGGFGGGGVGFDGAALSTINFPLTLLAGGGGGGGGAFLVISFSLFWFYCACYFISMIINIDW